LASGHQGFCGVFAKGGFHVVVIADGRGGQKEFGILSTFGLPVLSSRFSAHRVTVTHFSVLVSGTKGRNSL
jgi:hypothetical protein